ncbi:hypothetical protein E1J38_014795 [Seonamhaeicola sediminis]|uniref:Uncharacterized protein n=1 Tax=Seonamhaeicola sediminis TaxID=2528206 RepID=A0A562Y803_9FLAO|nr:hypothetical protein E1J38_014795 [Seonamhaeicola sediminis]
MRGLALNFASTLQTENPPGFSEVGENKQLLIANVVRRYFLYFVLFLLSNTSIPIIPFLLEAFICKISKFSFD